MKVSLKATGVIGCDFRQWGRMRATLTVESADAEMHAPDWCESTLQTRDVWPFSAVTSDPVSMFQTRTVLSPEPDSSRVPSDRSKQTHLTFAR